MSFNTFGHLFRVTTFGESHGVAIGCVVDGCPPRLPLTVEEITRVWEALDGSYQLSVSYEVSVVNIMPELEPERISPVEIAMPEYGLIVPPEPT